MFSEFQKKIFEAFENKDFINISNEELISIGMNLSSMLDVISKEMARRTDLMIKDRLQNTTFGCKICGLKNESKSIIQSHIRISHNTEDINRNIGLYTKTEKRIKKLST